MVVLRRAHVLAVHIHHERLRQRGAQDHAGQGGHRRVRRVRHTAVRALLPQHGQGTCARRPWAGRRCLGDFRAMLGRC